MFKNSRLALTPSYHWIPPIQRCFLEVLAQSGSIKRACAAVSMSRQAAYAFRRRKDAAENIPIQCQLPEKSAISKTAISPPSCAPRDERASRAIALIELQEHL